MATATGKRRRRSPAVAEQKLPDDVLVEIAARSSEPAILFRFAALCKSIRREILNPSFLRRVARIIPPRILAYIHYSRRPISHNRNQSLELSISLIHPATPAVTSLMDGILAPYMPRCTADIHGSYEPMMSRGSLVVLRRHHGVSIGRMYEQRCYDLCVFNPMTGDRTYLSCRSDWFRTYVLLTAADGIGSSFLLLATNVDMCKESGGFRITVQATNPGGTSWGPVTSDAPRGLLPFRPLQHQREPVVLHGGIIHWLLCYGDQVLTYDIRTQRLGTVGLPPTNHGGSERLLGKSPDGRLRLLVAKRFKVSMWVHLSDGWVKEAAVIDLEHKVRPPHPNIPIAFMRIEFKCWGERSGAVLLQECPCYRSGHRGSLIVLDLETKEMRRRKPPSHTSLLFEVDLSMRLQAMKIY